jgi:thiosulfate/3-mercaptopyruvate sulfurtransferase
MTGTLYGMQLLNAPAGFMMAGLIGLLFGLFLEQAGFGSSRKLTAVFYFKDMTVLKVMFTAIAVALVGYHYLVAFGWLDPGQVHALHTFWLAQTIGGLIFGAGFVIGGWCPGTAIVGLASAKLDALLFLVGVVLGSVFFNEVFILIKPIYTGMHGGALFVYDFIRVSPKLVPIIVCVIAVLAFIVSTMLERRIGGKPKTEKKALIANVAAAIVLLVFAAGIYVTPQSTSTPIAKQALRGFLTEIAGAEDHMGALELAHALMRGDEAFVVVDLRSREEYEQFHLRGAVNIPLETLARDAASKLPHQGQIVLYSNGTTHAAQAWLQLQYWGWDNVKVLTDGLLGFWRQCLTPPSLKGVVDENAALALSSEFKSREAYFLGDRDS